MMSKEVKQLKEIYFLRLFDRIMGIDAPTLGVFETAEKAKEATKEDCKKRFRHIDPDHLISLEHCDTQTIEIGIIYCNKEPNPYVWYQIDLRPFGILWRMPGN